MNRRERRQHQTPSTKRSYTLWLILAALALIVVGAIYYNATKPTGVDYSQYTYTDDLYAAPNATHVITEFSDFECPFCQQLAPTMRAVRDSHKGTVRIEYKHFPLRTIHPQAQDAAEAAECAREQNRFWAYHDVLFESKKIDKRSLGKHAQGMGLDMSQWDACIESGRAKATIQQNLLEGNQRGVRGTPSVYIDDTAFSGRTLEEFNAVLS